MKTLLVTLDFPPIIGGISTVFYNIWKHLSRQEHLILAPMAEGDAAWDRGFGTNMRRLFLPVGDSTGRKAACLGLLLAYSLWVVPKERVRYLVCGQPMVPGIVGVFFKRLFRVPFQVWVYGGEVIKFRHNRFLFGLLKLVLKEADTVVVNSAFTFGVFADLGVPREKLREITPAVDTGMFRPGLATDDLVERYGLAGKKVILTVARLSERKGHDMVLRALAASRDRLPDCRLLIVGTGPDEKRLGGLVSKLGIQDMVVFCGYISHRDLPRYYNLCDVHVMPNREVAGPDTIEGFGLSFIEASACEKPVIGGRSGGAFEAVENGVTGFLVDPMNVEELSDKIVLLLTDQAKAREMGIQGRKRALRQFQWEGRARIVEELLQSGKR
ncbi:MAG: glycosyltransferase family 4 protein [Candidatus Omnitrophica bacterium]|nr:glycosyltransferase family 4 protein [Candidatus Omnitrophota bacterium]